MTDVISGPTAPDVVAPAGLVDRRTVLAVAGAVGAVGVLAACSSGGSSPAPSAASAAPSEPASPTGHPKGNATVLASTSEVPVGGGKVIDGKMVVITQPKKGEFLAFNSTCTHQGCTVAGVQDGKIVCPCHGSEFSDTTGDVLRGPATQPLGQVDIEVAGTEIVAAT